MFFARATETKTFLAKTQVKFITLMVYLLFAARIQNRENCFLWGCNFFRKAYSISLPIFFFILKVFNARDKSFLFLCISKLPKDCTKSAQLGLRERQKPATFLWGNEHWSYPWKRPSFFHSEVHHSSFRLRVLATLGCIKPAFRSHSIGQFFAWV